MSTNTVSFKTKKPIALDVQIKSFGTHNNVPMSRADAYRVAASGVEAVIVDDETKEETPLTLENADTVRPAINPYTGEDLEKDPILEE